MSERNGSFLSTSHITYMKNLLISRELVYLFVLGVNEPNFQAEYSSHIAQTVNETLYRFIETLHMKMIWCKCAIGANYHTAHTHRRTKLPA